MANEARYPIKIESNAAQVASEGATALEQLRARIEASKNAVRGYSDSLKSLVGDSDEVVAAKKELKDRIDAEKTAMNRDTLEILKQGATYDRLTQAHKKAIADKKQLEAETKKNEAADKSAIPAINTLKSAIEEMTAAEIAAAAAEAAATAGIGILIGAVVGAAVAVPVLTKAFAEYALTSGNLLRTQQLNREAFVGNAEDALHLGNQIEALKDKTSQSRAELNAMATDLSQAGNKGNELVDALAAVSEESTALNDKAGAQLKEIISRGAQFNTFALGALELQGTGLKFADVASALAKNTHKSVDEAALALQQGRVTLGEGAAAMKDAVESRFGEINLKKMLDINVIATKFKDLVDSLTKDIHLDGLLKSFKELADLFDQGNESGQALKELVTFIGQGLADTFSGATPGMKAFIEELELGALDLQGSYLDLKLQFLETFGPNVLDNVDAFKTGMVAAQVAVAAISGWLTPIKESLKEIAILAPKIKEAFASGIIPKDVNGVLQKILPSHASGLEEVPRDDYVAKLHKGERVLTRAEAEAYKRIDAMSGSRSGSSSSASSAGASGPSFHVDHITVQIPATQSGGSPAQETEENARRGVLSALEIFARQRGLVMA